MAVYNHCYSCDIITQSDKCPYCNNRVSNTKKIDKMSDLKDIDTFGLGKVVIELPNKLG